MNLRTRDDWLHSTVALAVTCVAAAAFVVLATGCASQPDIRHDQDPGVDLRSYKTFAFFEPIASDGLRYRTLVDSKLKQATREQLEKQAFVYSEANPELRVNLFLNVLDKRELRSSPGGLYGYRGWSNRLETVDYRQGTLRIDLVDIKRNALVWQGVAEGRIDHHALSQPSASVDAVVSQMFAGFGGARVKP